MSRSPEKRIEKYQSVQEIFKKNGHRLKQTCNSATSATSAKSSKIPKIKCFWHVFWTFFSCRSDLFFTFP